jgi:predicted nuclease of predicted toxin-antitoxin system
LQIVRQPVTHVTMALPKSRTGTRGQSQASDHEIARWCARTEHVLVTVDEDFRGRWVRSGVLAAEGVEVIVFNSQPVGLAEQHELVTKHLRHWMSTLSRSPYQHRVWAQGSTLAPKLLQGRVRKPRSRAPAARKR